MNILLVHPYLKRGGSEARLLWSAEALKTAHQLTIVTTGGADLGELNAIYGTTIDASEVTIIETGLPWWIAKLKVGDALKVAWFNRKLRQFSPGLDLVLSTYHPIALRMPTIQFVADFSWDDAERRRLHPEQGWLGFMHGDNGLRRIYLGFVRWLSKNPPAPEILRSSAAVISNSVFSAEILKQRYGMDSQVIYPPVAGDFPDITWEQRKNRFVLLGRVSPEKELEKAIAIIEGVRQRGHEAELLIIGEWQTSAYGRELHGIASEKGGWLQFAGDCRGEKKARLLAESRYGIHARTGEAFGIAVAEMLKAGCIPFVPQEGGPREIVGDDRLVYVHPHDAVDNIVSVMQDNVLQEMLQRKLVRRSERFSEETFMHEVKALVAAIE